MEEIQQIFACICMIIFGRFNNLLICFMQYALKVSGLEYFESKKETFSRVTTASSENAIKRQYPILFSRIYVLFNVNHYSPRCSVKNEGQILKHRLRK